MNENLLTGLSLKKKRNIIIFNITTVSARNFVTINEM